RLGTPQFWYIRAAAVGLVCFVLAAVELGNGVLGDSLQERDIVF
ncbi:MAG: hypothetical protein ACI9W2_003990, partial [Gammaproteobacteria bacterium]